MTPAEQALNAEQGLIRNGQLRLEPKLEFAAAERLSQFVAQAEPLLSPDLHSLVEEGAMAATGALRVVKREVGVRE